MIVNSHIQSPYIYSRSARLKHERLRCTYEVHAGDVRLGA